MSKVTRIRFDQGKKRPPPPPPPPDDTMKELFDMSLDVIRDELADGSARMATWFADAYFKHESKRLRVRLDLKIGTAKELEDASRDVVMAAASGTITFDECKELQDALARHAVLSGIREIDEMRERLTDLAAKQKNKHIGANGMTPTWGRLSEAKGN